MRGSWQSICSLFSRVTGRNLYLTSSIPIVSILADERERGIVAAASLEERWDFSNAETCEDAWAKVTQMGAPVVLVDKDLPGIDWRIAVETLASSPHRPCVILISKVSDHYLWDELTRLGGYDVLPRPLAAGEVARVVRLALTFWRNMATVISSDSAPSLEGERIKSGG